MFRALNEERREHSAHAMRGFVPVESSEMELGSKLLNGKGASDNVTTAVANVRGGLPPRVVRRLLEHIGFRQEGIARAYLQIAGRWQDHLFYALLDSDVPPPVKQR